MYRKNKAVIELIKEARHNYLSVIKSYDLANLVNKQHKAVCRDIRQEITRIDMDGIDSTKMFIPTVEKDYRNRLRPVYLITSQGILHLLARYGRYDYQLRYCLTDLMKNMDNTSEHLYSRK